jgi:hypothetical protein
MRKSPDEVNLQPEGPRGVDTILGEHHPCTASRIAQYEERVVTSEDHILQELLSMYLVGPHADNRKGGREANHAGGSVSSWALVAVASRDRGWMHRWRGSAPQGQAQKYFFVEPSRQQPWTWTSVFPSRSLLVICDSHRLMLLCYS